MNLLDSLILVEALPMLQSNAFQAEAQQWALANRVQGQSLATACPGVPLGVNAQ